MRSASRRIQHAFLAVVGGLLAACGGEPPPVGPAQTYTISGAVSPASEGVAIRVEGPDSGAATTDATGAFSVSGLHPGTYTVSATLPGFVFEPTETQVTITNADATTVSLSRQAPTEGLSPEDITSIDAQPERVLPADSVILPNAQTLDAYTKARGLPENPNEPPTPGPNIRLAPPLPAAAGPQQKKNDIITTMLNSARDFSCGRTANPCTKWDHDADPQNPATYPANRGLVYVYGGKNPYARTRPVDGCPQYTFGTDCSGLISRVAAAAGMVAPAGSVAQSNPDNWALPPEWKLKWKRIDGAAYESGDLLAWIDPARDVRHIGIASTSGVGGTVTFISSLGIPADCPNNVNPPRGPRSLTISGFKVGPPTTVLRLVTTLSGDFDMYIRCTDRSTDAAVIRFTINNDQGGPFSATGTGTDYDGTPLSFTLNGTYDQTSNVVTATLAFADGTRSDGFTIKLLEDDTGYFPLTKVIDNGGCFASARLVRVNPDQAGLRRRLPQPAPGAPMSPRLGGPPRP